MTAAGSVAATIAANNAPSGENRVAHAALWGSGTAAVTGVAGLYIFDEQQRSQEINRKLEVAVSEIRALRGESEQARNELLIGADSTFPKSLPDEFKNLVRPGKWSIFKISQWINQGENTLIHQDKMIRLEPAQFRPNVETNEKGEKKDETVSK